LLAVSGGVKICVTPRETATKRKRATKRARFAHFNYACVLAIRQRAKRNKRARPCQIATQ
jgi:hypothetical protein